MNIFDQAERHAVVHGFEDLRDRLRAEEDQARERVREANRLRAIERDRQQILRDYAAAGIDPIYSRGGELVSLTLARKTGHPGLHATHSGMVRDGDDADMG